MYSIYFILISTTVVNSCPQFARGPFATANSANWTWDAATETCTTQHLTEYRADTYIWSGDFCTVSPIATTQEAAQLTDIFITKWYCAHKCYTGFWQVAVSNYVHFACVHGDASVDSESPHDVTVKCECGDGVGEPLLTTLSVTFQEIHEEFTTSCSLDSPINTCSQPTFSSLTASLTTATGQYPWTDGTYQPGTVMTANCIDPAEVIISGEPSTTCQSNGQWSVNPVILECGTQLPNSCGTLDDVTITGEETNSTWAYNSTSVGDSFALHTVAQKACAEGFALAQDSTAATIVTVTCSLEGWSPVMPCCVQVSGCTTMEDLTLPNTEGSWNYDPIQAVTSDTVPAGTTGSILCADGFEASLTGEIKLTATCSNQWTIIDRCVPRKCNSLDDIKITGEVENSTWTYSTTGIRGSFQIDTIAHKSCAEGYALESSPDVTKITLTCTLNGWIPKLPCCVPVEGCPLLDVLKLPNTNEQWVYNPEPVNDRNVQENTIAYTSCNSDSYATTNGTNLTVTCNGNKWSEVGQCLVCDHLPTPMTCENGTQAVIIDFPQHELTAAASTVIKNIDDLETCSKICLNNEDPEKENCGLARSCKTYAYDHVTKDCRTFDGTFDDQFDLVTRWNLDGAIVFIEENSTVTTHQHACYKSDDKLDFL